MGKILINARVPQEVYTILRLLRNDPRSPFKTDTELIRECLYEGALIVQRKVETDGYDS